MSTLSIIILTKNEEKDIEATIRKARQWADEVLVVDSGSKDRTVELAENNGARVVFRAWDNDFAAQRNFALTQTYTDWVLYLDADERMNDQLVQAIRNVIAKDTANATATMSNRKQYSLQRKSIAFGKKFSHGPLHPDWVTRLFPRESVTWVGKVHEHPECSLPLEKLPGHIEHYTYRNWQEWKEKMGRYSTLWAEEAYQKGRRTSLSGALLHGIASLFRMLILHLGFLDGWKGICLSCMYCFYTLQKYLKLYQLQRERKVKKGF